MKLWFSSKGQNPEDILSKLQKDAKHKVPKMPSIPKNIDFKLPANVNLKTVTDFLQHMIRDLSKLGSTPSGPSRPMKFPYTFSAKIAQFPYKYYYKHNWMFRWYPIAFACCLPVFWYIGTMANSKENKAKWKEIRRLEKEEALHKFDYH